MATVPAAAELILLPSRVSDSASADYAPDAMTG